MVTSTLTDRITAFPPAAESHGAADPGTRPHRRARGERPPTRCRAGATPDAARRRAGRAAPRPYDDRVHALVAKPAAQDGPGPGPGAAAAIARSRRPASSRSPGRRRSVTSRGNVPYYLATAFDADLPAAIIILGLTGISMQNWYYRGALDKLGIKFQVGQPKVSRARPRGPDTPTRVQARETLQRMAASIVEQITGDGQRLEILRRGGPGADRQPARRGQRGAEPAWWTRFGYRDEVYAAVRKEAGPDARCSSSAATTGPRCSPSGPALLCPNRVRARSH